MKKLYKVTATFEYVVVAEDSYDARYVAADYYMKAIQDSSSDCIDINIDPYTSGCIDGWDDDIEPYGDDSAEKTTGEYLNS